jgi:hypothetical protein
MQQMKHLKTWLDEHSRKLGTICILQSLVDEDDMAKQLRGGQNTYKGAKKGDKC